jgi:signal transduction histidine kinase/HPt (histidine-containing phosphotransfer) domain-containing protein/FixJ family two-component response regulator
MTRKKESMPLKIALLLFAGVIIIVFSGYLSYRSISSVVTMIYENNAPDNGLATIREITTTIDRAENNVRLYSLTKEDYYLYKYRTLVGGIDSLIENLYNQYPENEWFSRKIDTISILVDTKIGVWREMITIWQFDTTQQAISNLAERFQPEEQTSQEDTVVAREGFFKRVFGRRNREVQEEPEEIAPQNEEILEMIGEIEKIERETGLRLQAQETELTRSSSSLTEAFLSLMGQLEAYERARDLERYEQAGELSEKTYFILGIFSISATLLSILVFFLVIKYTRKNREYNEALIRSREKTEELARAKELFMANVSHEIRNPLNAISGFIKQVMNMPVEKGIREKIEIVDSASEQLIRLANDTLDLSKLQAGKLTLHNRHFDPEAEVHHVCTLFTRLAEEKNNTLRYKVVNDDKVRLFGDSQRFQQILYNLLSNAIKFTENGSIEVFARLSPCEGDEVNLTLSVKDTGTGIEASKLEDIFEDFTQENEDTAVKYGGTGLGLSIVKKLVELFQGDVKIESVKGSGTNVTCQLRFTVGDDTRMEHERAGQETGSIPGGLRFLVADDEEYNRKLIITILEKWNAAYDVASNGVDAVNMLSIHHYDMVMMDLRMPGINGINATKFIRETLKLSNDQLPVLGITADALDKMGDGAKGLFNGFLIKPFSEWQMYEAIRRILGMSGREYEKWEEEAPESGNQLMEGDLSNLVQMSGNDMEFVEEMIHKFENSTHEGLQEMKEAMEEGRFGTVRDLAHKLKPPSRHLGLTTLGKLLEEIETRAPRGNRSVLRDLIDEAKKSSTDAGRHLHDQFRQLHK